MTRFRIASFGLLLALLPLVVSCDKPQRERCTQCGMPIDETSRWNAGLTNAQGAAQRFDTPKCLFRFLASDDGRGASLPWFTEYYSQTHRPATSLRFVIGSDLIGPMGADLIPIEGDEAARRFGADHAGDDVLTFEQVDAARLQSLDPP